MKNFLATSLLAGFAFAAAAANPVVELETSAGSMSIELYPEKAPGTVENFLNYARSGFYAGTVFHRVIDGFMIQGGGFDANMKEKPTREPIRTRRRTVCTTRSERSPWRERVIRTRRQRSFSSTW